MNKVLIKDLLLELLCEEKETEEKETDDLFEANTNYFIQTVTNYFIGRCVAVKQGFVILDNCSWVAYTGRYTQFLSGEMADEVEVFPPDVKVNCQIEGIVNYLKWAHKLPTEQK